MIASKHLPRIATGAVLILLLAAVLWSGSMWLYGFAYLFAAVAMWEFLSLFWQGTGLAVKLCGLGLCTLLFVGAWCGSVYIPLALSLCMLILAMTFLIRYGMGRDVSLHGPALVAIGLLYVPLPLLFALQLDLREQLLLIGIVFAADTGAYCAGNAWGKHRVWPRVSPKKSVEGCIGGLFASMLIGVLFSLSYGSGAWLSAALLGILLCVAAMLGDFFESALKRVCQVKDSGTMLPGHGGVLDRLDSLLFVVPVYLAAKHVWPLF